MVGKKVREDGAYLRQISFSVNVIGGNDCCVVIGGRFGVEALVLVFVPRVWKIKRGEAC